MQRVVIGLLLCVGVALMAFSPVERFGHLRDGPTQPPSVGDVPVWDGNKWEPGAGDGSSGATSSAFINYPHRPYPATGDPTLGLRIDVHADGQHNAFPGLALTPAGDLIGAWRAAPQHVVETGADRGRIMLSRSADLGRTWGAPTLAVDDDPDDARDPALTTLSDGRIALSYMTNDGTGATTWVRFSSDGGKTWGQRTQASANAVSAPVVELDDGTLLLPVYGGGDAVAVFSTDNGTTWGDPATMASAGGNWTEPYVQLLDNGDLLALHRENDGRDTYGSTSTDNGATWTMPSFLFSGSGRPSHLQFSSGAIVVLYRVDAAADPDKWFEGRVSRDRGATWSDAFTFDDGQKMVYAQLVEVSGGQAAVLYALEDTAASEADIFFRYLIDGEGLTAVGDDTLTEHGTHDHDGDYAPIGHEHAHGAAGRMVVLSDFGSGPEPVTDSEGLWLYGAFDIELEH